MKSPRLPAKPKYRVDYKSPIRKQLFLELRQDWAYCHRCPLESRRSMLVHYRGVIPCNVLFIGEAPGRSEDVTGFPFVGDAGQKVLDPLLAAVTTKRSPRKFRWGIANVVACMPEEPDNDGGWQLRDPTKDEAATCWPRLLRLIKIANPERIIFMGDVARRMASANVRSEWFELPESELKRSWPHDSHTLNITHPAWILRQGGTSSGAYKKALLQVLAFLENMP